MSNLASGRSLELYYIDGRPDGMLTAEMFNWTGHVLVTPRTQILEALARPEAALPGVYLLLGERDSDGEPLAYIGESEDVGSRLRSHISTREWWTTAVFVTASNRLNKAHCRYLEARLIELARDVGRVNLDNGTSPPRPPLAEVDQSRMAVFLESLLVVLPAVRLDMFIERKRAPTPRVETPITSQMQSDPPRFILERNRLGVEASAVFRDGELIVEAGSKARLEWSKGESVESSYARLYQDLRRSGVLVPGDKYCTFIIDYAFRSPSAAASVVTGRSSNGAKHWKLANGTSYGIWEAQRVADELKRFGV